MFVVEKPHEYWSSDVEIRAKRLATCLKVGTKAGKCEKP